MDFYDYEDMEIDYEIDDNVILVKMLKDFGLSNLEISEVLGRSNLNFEVIMRFFINNYNSDNFDDDSVDYNDMFIDEDFEIDEKIENLVMTLIQIYNINLTDIIEFIVNQDNHIQPSDKNMYVNQLNQYYVDNDFTNFVENIKYPFMNYIYFLFENYNSYRLDIEDDIENFIDFFEDGTLNYENNLSYDTEEES